MLRKLTYIAAVSATIANIAVADNIMLYREGDNIDPHEVAHILGISAAKPGGAKSRSIRLLSETEPETVGSTAEMGPRPPQTQPEKKPSAFALPVQFAFDSATILPSATTQLDAVAAGIKLLPATSIVTIEGHTDARGPDWYNLDLSERRAMAVKQYLVAKHGIEKSMLKILAKGEHEPYDSSNPYAAENRRVQFRGS